MCIQLAYVLDSDIRVLLFIFVIILEYVALPCVWFWSEK